MKAVYVIRFGKHWLDRRTAWVEQPAFAAKFSSVEEAQAWARSKGMLLDDLQIVEA